jgi:beta-lactamase regulating signal transducer with metallopeptidase domain
VSLLLEWLIEGAVLAVLAMAVARFIPPRYAAQRHAFWWLTLVSLALLPVRSAVSRGGLAAPVDAWTTATVPGPIGSDGGTAAIGLAGVAAFDPIVVPPVPKAIAGAAGAIWLAFALVSLVRLFAGLGAVRRLARDAAPIDAVLDNHVRRRLREGRRVRAAAVVASDRLAGACAVGFRRPRIVVSSSLVRQADRQTLEAIVLHEYAHLARFDDWTRLIQRMLLIVIGVHPAARWISRQIDAECEAACDRFVLDRRVAPGVYARALANAAEIALGGPPFPSGAVPAAFAPGAALHQRVARVLSQSRVGPRTARRASLCGASAVALAVLLAAAGPPVVVTGAAGTPVVNLSAGPEAFSNGRLASFTPADAGDAFAPANVGDAARPASSAAIAASGRTPSTPQAASPSMPAPMPSSGDASGPAGSPDIAKPGGAQPPLASKPLAPAPPVSAPLASAPLARARLVPGVAVAGENRSEAGWAALGDSAASAGTATGAAAARAGSAIGRAFRRGGLAIANRF